MLTSSWVYTSSILEGLFMYVILHAINILISAHITIWCSHRFHSEIGERKNIKGVSSLPWWADDRFYVSWYWNLLLFWSSLYKLQFSTIYNSTKYISIFVDGTHGMTSLPNITLLHITDGEIWTSASFNWVHLFNFSVIHSYYFCNRLI